MVRFAPSSRTQFSDMTGVVKAVVPMNAIQRTQMKQYLADGSDYSEENNDSYQEERDHSPYNWEGNAYYNGKVGKLGIDLNLDFLTNKTTEETSINETRNADEERPVTGRHGNDFRDSQEYLQHSGPYVASF